MREHDIDTNSFGKMELKSGNNARNTTALYKTIRSYEIIVAEQRDLMIKVLKDLESEKAYTAHAELRRYVEAKYRPFLELQAS